MHSLDAQFANCDAGKHNLNWLHAARSGIATYCANPACQNSHVLAHRLQVLGYRNVAVFPGGKKEWTEARLQLESATTAAV